MKVLGDNRGSGALQMVMMMGILSLGLVSAMSLVSATGALEGKMASGFREEEELWKKAGRAREGLEALWKNGQGPSRAEWTAFCQEWKASGCVARELSSRINPEWIPVELLSGKGFAEWFTGTGAALSLAGIRDTRGFTLYPSLRYKDVFRPGFDFGTLTCWSAFNLLAGDEAVLARAYGSAALDPSAADVFRLRLHEARVNKRHPDALGLDTFLAPHARDLEGLFSLEPAFNLNLMEADTLRCLLDSPVFALGQPDQAFDILIALRGKGFVPKAEIPFRHLGCKNLESPGPESLASWLGDDSDSFSLEIRGKTRKLEIVLAAQDLEGGQKAFVPIFHSLGSPVGEADHGE